MYYADIFYYVKPMWRVNCLKASGAQQELEEAYGDDEPNTVAYTQLLVDAQNGRDYRPEQRDGQVECTRAIFRGKT